MLQLIDFFLTYPRAFWGLCFSILLAWGLGWAFGEVTSEGKEKSR